MFTCILQQVAAAWHGVELVPRAGADWMAAPYPWESESMSQGDCCWAEIFSWADGHGDVLMWEEVPF